MSPSLSQSSMERKVVRRYWNDGLLDLVCGIGTLAIGIFWQLDLIALGPVVPALLIPLWPLLRRRITGPRAGYVEFSDERENRQRVFLMASVGLGLAVFVAVVGTAVVRAGRGADAAGMSLAAAIPNLILALMAVSAFALTHVRWFALYAGVLASMGVFAAALGKAPGWAIILGGAVVATIGSFRLAGFLRRHPANDRRPE